MPMVNPLVMGGAPAGSGGPPPPAQGPAEAAPTAPSSASSGFNIGNCSALAIQGANVGTLAINTLSINTTGGGTAQTVLRDSAVTIVAFNLGNPAFGNASSGTITLNGTPIGANASASGDVDNATITARDGSTALACSVTATGMGGDIEVTNPNISNGQSCILTGMTYSAQP